MTLTEILSPHMRDIVAAVLPTVSSNLSDRSSDKIDLATAENWLIRPELQRLCKEAIQNHLTADVCVRSCYLLDHGAHLYISICLIPKALVATPCCLHQQLTSSTLTSSRSTLSSQST